ncbi:hypothetical protein EVAR_24621_1 [Eumeta japonica]|uniref:Uncharacterized protein n=1 Tax=Eumeta variegata TaxID=151549 RepID=A0A4C1V2E3_EUMVA|nr:hypothetical protein EVAR_24621_1 [Eumeta japonica]
MREDAQEARIDQVRELFALILTSCNPSAPNGLCQKYRDGISDDILARMRSVNLDLDITFNVLLRHLSSASHSNSDFDSGSGSDSNSDKRNLKTPTPTSVLIKPPS